MPDTIRSSGCCARPWRGRRASAMAFPGFFTGFFMGSLLAAVPASADQPPKLVLHEFVQGATRSIDRHEIVAIVLLAGLLLFAVVTAIMLLRTRSRLLRLEATAHD